MHISEGILSFPVLATGAGVAGLGLALGLYKMPWEQSVKIGLLASAFFVASFIHLPLGAGSVHLIMNGLVGIMLGTRSFIAIAVALLLQAVLFNFGGITTLGVNICIMAIPAVMCGLLFRPFLRNSKSRAVSAFLCGSLAVLFSAVLSSLALYASGESFLATAWLFFVAHLPIMLVEGLVTAAIIVFIMKVAPEILDISKPSLGARNNL